MDQLLSEATQFFDEFVHAFATFEGSSVARLFSHPYLAVDEQGNQRVFSGPEDTGKYFQGHLDRYKSDGSERCSYELLEVMALGLHGALVSVTWRLENAAGRKTSSWRESYCVSRKDGQLKAYASIDHAA